MESIGVENLSLFVDESFSFNSVPDFDHRDVNDCSSSSSSVVGDSNYEVYDAVENGPSCVGIDSGDGLKFWIPLVDEELKPIVGKVFDSLEEGVEMYKKYASNSGFDIRLSSVKKNANSVVLLRYVVCNRAGLPLSIQANTLDSTKKKVRSTNIRRTGCDACVKFKICPDGRSYVLYAFEEKHNHCLFDEDSKHLLKSSRKLDYSQQRWILKMANVNIGATKAHNILCELKGGHEKVGGTKVEFKNFQRDRSCFIGDTDANLFVKKMNNRKMYVPNYSFEYKCDNGLLSCAFWADETAKRNFEEFGDIVSFDATFRTNK